MLNKKEYIGIALDGKSLNVVTSKLVGKKIELTQFKKLSLFDYIEEEIGEAQDVFEDTEDQDAEDIFGIDEEEESSEDEMTEIDLDDLDSFEEADEDLDIVEESDQPQSNELILHNYLFSNGKKKNHIAINIISGNTIFQFASDTDYSKSRKKDLQDLVESKLHSLYGHVPGKDNYSYFVRDDGSLAIASVDKEPSMLTLANKVNEISTQKLFIEDIIPDEVALTGLYRVNYEAEEDQITSLIQFGTERSRIIVFRGHEVLQVSPVINEGTNDKNFLNTIFSKILFQLDTGEVPGLDKIVLADNTEGEKAIEFFQKNFPDLVVENFQLNPEKYEIYEELIPKVAEFTTSIALATRAIGFEEDKYPKMSFLPDYVEDRQKIFKLQWHGVVLLIMIGLTPIVLNHFYQKYNTEIERLEAENNRLQNMITEIDPIVEQTEYLQEMMGIYQGQLSLLEELIRGNVRWTTNLDRFNRAVQDVGGIWVTGMRQVGDGIAIQGYSLFESRIPALARQFSNVTLQNVRKEELRDRDVFVYTMLLKDVVGDENLYTPESSRDIRELLNTNN